MIANVLICDDKTDRAERWKSLIESHLPSATVDTLTGAKLAGLLTELSDAEDEARDGQALNNESRGTIGRVEQADLLILDSDLSPAPGDLGLLQADEARDVSRTLRNGYGDDVARQLRSYSMAPAIVVVNMFWGRHARPRVFDLTLNQNANAVADLNITAGELADDVLWGRAVRDTAPIYRPWQRATIPEVVATFKLSAGLSDDLDLDERVLERFAIDSSRLTPSQLDPFSKAPEDLTFHDFANSGLGFKYTGTDEGGAFHEPTYVKAMALSAVRRWIERFVTPSQTVLLDAPHLAERYWRVITSDPADLAALDRFAEVAWGGDVGHFQPALRDALRPFATRPVFDESVARKVAAQQARSGAAPVGSLDAAFAEDISKFRPLGRLTQFPSDVPGEFKHRWLEEVAGVGYEPSNRLLL
ncbi:hypothetical protein AB0230_08760 [Microbacterium sp. NPDC089190]|uniref:hypothetical protein n=1 Tax=Microbacterium sp. NPDC089190 TaxID=3155063 RepID=UPI00344BD75A